MIMLIAYISAATIHIMAAIYMIFLGHNSQLHILVSAYLGALSLTDHLIAITRMSNEHL
jgi:hypothetical protein